MRVTYASEILRPPEAVFPWIAEPEKAMQWQKNVKGGDITVNKSGVVGTTFNEQIEEGGESLQMTGTITRFIPNQLIEFHLESRLHQLDVNYSVEGLEGTTRIIVDADIQWKFPMNIMSLFIGGKIKKGIADQLEAEINELKRICESG
jgi:hypothetical protein